MLTNKNCWRVKSKRQEIRLMFPAVLEEKNFSVTVSVWFLLKQLTFYELSLFFSLDKTTWFHRKVKLRK